MTRTARAFALVVVLAACGGGDAKGSIAVSTPEGPRAADDLAITTHDGGMILGVRHDTIRMRLSDSARATAKKEMAKATADTSGGSIGNWIKAKVVSTVEKGMQLEMSVPVTSIRSLAREDSSIRFEMKDGKSVVGFSSKSKSKGTVGTFAPADADKFIAFVHPKLAP